MILIFDCDGVVLDSMPLHTEVEAKAYQDLGIPISAEELARRFSGVSQDEVSKTLGHEMQISIPDTLEGEIEKEKERVFTERLQAMKGIQNTLEALNEIPRCIASGTGLSGLKHMLGVVGLYDSFAPHIYSSEMVERGKPFPDLFLYAASQMNAAPESCLVIEDGIAGIQAACAARMRVFGFSGGSHCDDEHKQFLHGAGAELVFDDMNDLPNLIKERVKQ